MEAKSPSECPNTVTVRRNPHRRARPTPSASTNPNPNVQNPNMKREISSFPIQDILAMEIPQRNPPEPPAPATSENLKVYLRIRPVVTLKPNTKDQKNFRQRQKNAWPQNPPSKNNSANVKKNTTTTTISSNEVCIDVIDSHSVTLSPPASLQDSKRIKSEVYEGFSHVFASDSTQNEVFEKMVKPLVDGFLNGKSGLLAALGPSGSGKTHTVFGTPREPGMVHLALEQIFKEAQQCGSKLTREFKVSVFEIYSDRGKGEKISDLSPDGGDLSMQQATIKGLQEVAISSAAQAESLIACAMLKRTTAMTNTNSQSSRSQCIINIHSFIRDPDVEPNNAVLTIVDLAGAEREKRTGNQGSRLIESNFINNTSMVFGLCLRSLLEHQSNPKKPLKMHFKNSMLTRYLRDYLEGKRRMTLLLTVKPGEYDYSDTSYLLRQASPFMKIKFTNVEEPSTFLNKRHIEMLPRVEQAKKMKCSGRYAKTDEGKSDRDEHPLLPKDTKRIYTSNSVSADSVSTTPIKPDSIDLPRERNHQVMQNFAKALWNVLKQYKEKLMVAEREIQGLNEVIANEKTRYLKLEKELKDFKSYCSCSMENSTVSTLVNIDTKSKAPDPKCHNDFEPGNDQHVFAEAPECNTTQKFDGTPGHDQNISFEIDESAHFLNLKASKCDGSPRKDREATPKKCDSTSVQDQNVIYEIQKNDHFLNLKTLECDGSSRKDQGVTKKYDYNLGHDQHSFFQIEEKDHFLNLKVFECNGSLIKDQCVTKKYDYTPGHDQHVFSKTEEHVHSLNLRTFECDGFSRKYQDVVTKKSLDPSVSPKDVASTQKCNLDVPESELLSDSSCKPLNVLKPKRRLLPASSTLLRDIPLGIEDESEKPKMPYLFAMQGNRGAKKSAADETKRTQGSISLLRLLQRNLHV
ncbi:PREDICTED: kinesin heavy chain isoform X1 [Populus euphratica]|uniref:Kinesin heavy chain isoform X1 n=1 Tax=Populus euphratica TaxID=75702 RepID=A0AAJ6VGC9_POPEU|nr:PREDICTED: kinesin heavy chain isoform X1 [Populus euphratica]